MLDQFARTRILIGEDGIKRLQRARVAIFGIGGVGGYVVESLTRAGVGTLDLIDNDTVSTTNLNRQMVATVETVGESKVQAMKKRCLLLNPQVNIYTHECFYLPETAEQFDFTQYDYIVDAVDTVTAKLTLIEKAKEVGVPIISCMGAGNKLHSQMFMVSDLYKTTMCPLAKVMRRECKKRSITSLKVVYSTEETVSRKEDSIEETSKRQIPGSTPFAPAVAGLLLAEEVFRDLAGVES